TRQPWEDPTGDRKSVIGDLANALLADMLRLGPDRWAEVSTLLSALAHERHIQALSFRPEEQLLLQQAGWSGQLETPPGDYVHFNEASVMSTKLNLIIAPVGEYRVELNELGDASHHLTLRYENGL